MTWAYLGRLISRCAVSVVFTSAYAYAAQPPANPNASNAAKNVLNYLYSLSAKTENKVVSGQSFSYSSSEQREQYDEFITAVYQQSGQYPGLIGTDLMFGPPEGPYPSDWANSRLIDHWNNNGLVTINWHASNPVTLGDAHDKTIDFSKIYVEGTAENRAWKTQLDMTASILAQLQDAGVVVLWRPMHEMQAHWWWAKRDDYAEAWKYMFNYFTFNKKLNNLLWVYGATRTEGIEGLLKYYPGNDYVDVVGVSYYSEDIWNSIKDFYNTLASTGKAFALTELGLGGNPTDRPAGAVDYYRIIQRIKTLIPDTAYFFCWHSDWAIARNLKAHELMNDPWTANRGELDYGSSPPQDMLLPEILSFTVSKNTTTRSTIAWDVKDTGGAHLGGIKVFRAVDAGGIPGSTWKELLSMEVVFTTSVDADERTLYDGVPSAGIYWYKIKLSDKAGNTVESSAVSVDLTTINSPPAAPGGLIVK